VPAGTVSDHVSVQYDLFPTLAQLTGDPVSGLDGISFLPILTGSASAQKKHSFLYFEYPENGGQIAVYLGDWKGIRKNLRKQPDAPWELYDLSRDINEKTDQAALHPDILRKMEEIVRREHMHPHVSDWEILDSKLSR
jgi:arylsulfatase A-like enzyme